MQRGQRKKTTTKSLVPQSPRQRSRREWIMTLPTDSCSTKDSATGERAGAVQGERNYRWQREAIGRRNCPEKVASEGIDRDYTRRIISLSFLLVVGESNRRRVSSRRATGQRCAKNANEQRRIRSWHAHLKVEHIEETSFTRHRLEIQTALSKSSHFNVPLLRERLV